MTVVVREDCPLIQGNKDEKNKHVRACSAAKVMSVCQPSDLRMGSNEDESSSNLGDVTTFINVPTSSYRRKKGKVRRNKQVRLTNEKLTEDNNCVSLKNVIK